MTFSKHSPPQVKSFAPSPQKDSPTAAEQFAFESPHSGELLYWPLPTLCPGLHKPEDCVRSGENSSQTAYDQWADMVVMNGNGGMQEFAMSLHPVD